MVIDGWFGPETESALKAYQRDHGMQVTGVADLSFMLKLVVARAIILREVAENDTRQNRDLVRALKKSLQQKGYYSGMLIDGWFGPETTDAVKAFQRDNGMKVTGIADEAFCKKLSSR